MAVFAVALPALVCLLFVLGVAEVFWLRLTGRGLLPWPRRDAGSTISATGFDELTASFQGSKRIELEHRATQMVLRPDDTDGAPPRDRVDLDRNVARIRLP